MNYKKLLGAASAARMFAIVVTLLLAPGALAQSKYKTLYKFKGGKDGSGLLASVIFDQAGNLYGMTFGGGGDGAGTIFELSPNQDGSWTEKVLHSFTGGKDGAWPADTLIFDQAGNLYGTAEVGADLKPCRTTTVPGCGVVFELTPSSDGSWKEKVLYSFKGGKDGLQPFASLIFDSAGNLYGTTYYGGDDGAGTIFELSPNQDGSWTEKVLHSFTGGKDQGYLFAGLTFDQAGNLYGTTTNYLVGAGTIFELSPNQDGSWTEKVLHSFTGGKDGAWPYAGVIFDQAGNLYGTTVGGGDLSSCDTAGCGVVFKLAPNSNGRWTETVLHTFMDHPGAFSYPAMIFDRSGNLYGTTRGDDRTTFGSVFAITP